MNRNDLQQSMEAQNLNNFLTTTLPPLHQHMHGAHSEGMTSLREANYKGHQIRIYTTYRIEIDDFPLGGHAGVANNGTVHYHSIPNRSFASAVTMVEYLLDAFPADFAAISASHHEHE